MAKITLDKTELHQLMSNKRFQVLEWIQQKGFITDSDFYCHCVDIESLQWLSTNRMVKMNKTTVLANSILLNRNAIVLGWMISNGAIINDSAIRACVVKNNLTLLTWLLEKNLYTPTNSIIVECIKLNSISFIRALVDYSALSTRLVIDDATKRVILTSGNEAVLSWYFREYIT